MVSALKGPTAHWEARPSRCRVVCVAVDWCSGAESSPARLGKEGPSGDFLETQKPKLSRKRLSRSWAGKEVEKGVPGRRNSTGRGLGGSACSHAPSPFSVGPRCVIAQVSTVLPAGSQGLPEAWAASSMRSLCLGPATCPLCLQIYSSSLHLSICSSVRPSIHPSMNLSVYLSNHLFIQPASCSFDKHLLRADGSQALLGRVFSGEVQGR